MEWPIWTKTQLELQSDFYNILYPQSTETHHPFSCQSHVSTPSCSVVFSDRSKLQLPAGTGLHLTILWGKKNTGHPTQTGPTGREISHTDCCLSISLNVERPAKLFFQVQLLVEIIDAPIRSGGPNSSITAAIFLNNRQKLTAGKQSFTPACIPLSWGESNGLLLNYLPFNQWHSVGENISRRTAGVGCWGGSVSIKMEANGWPAYITVSRFIRHSSQCSRDINKRRNGRR